MFLCQYWQSNRSIKWHESALDCVRPEPPSVDYYGYQQTSQAILWDGLQKSREVAAAAASMAQEGDNCGKKWRSFVSRTTGSAAALEEILSSRRLCRLGQSAENSSLIMDHSYILLCFPIFFLFMQTLILADRAARTSIVLAIGFLHGCHFLFSELKVS